MKRIILSYLCGSKENRDAFYEELKKNDIAGKCENEKGNIGYKYYFPAADDTSILLIEQWESDEALESHKQQPHFIFMQQLKAKMNIETKPV